MSIDTKRLEVFAKKHLVKIGDEKVKKKAWIDKGHVLAMSSERLNIINSLSMYEELQIERYETLEKQTEENAYVNSYFNIDYLKEVLKLMTTTTKDKEKDTVLVKVSLADDKPMKLVLIREEVKKRDTAHEDV